MSASENLEIYARLRELCSRLETPEQRREAAARWEVAESTVRRWANGTARPRPGIARLIVKYLEEKK